MLGITDDNNIKKNKAGKRKRRGVTFNDEECVINPEDVDPNVGRFRNLVQTTVVPTKRAKLDTNYIGFPSTATTASASDIAKHLHPTSFMPHLYQDLPPLIGDGLIGGHGPMGKTNSSNIGGATGYSIDVEIAPVSPVFGSKLGLLLPNPAPDVDPTAEANPTAPPALSFGVAQQGVFQIFRCSF